MHTAPFLLPEDNTSFHQRTLSGVHNVPTSQIERAWNEVRKLQSNLESGYYSHSSGESDMPSSDEEYSDDIYLRPRRRSSAVGSGAAVSRSNSPRSSTVTINSVRLKAEKKRPWVFQLFIHCSFFLKNQRFELYLYCLSYFLRETTISMFSKFHLAVTSSP